MRNTTCTIENCKQKHYARGFCRDHFHSMWKIRAQHGKSISADERAEMVREKALKEG